MGRYSDVQSKIYSVFGSNTWAAEGIKTFPNDIVPTDVGNEYIRVTIITSGQGINRTSLSGICIIDIFTAAGMGPTRAGQIADILDRHLGNKVLGNVQFQSSTMVPKGVDKDNSSLTRSQYTIPFNLYGVT